MNIINIIILLIIAMGAIVGFKQGGIARLTSFLGTILVFSLSWIFKDKIASIIYEYVPFVHFRGELSGLDSLNILFYELISFALIFVFLTAILRMLLVATGLIEKMLKLTIFLSIPSKILGIFVGAIEAYFYVFLALIILNLPMIDIQMVKDSEVANFILNDTVVLSNVSEKLIKTYDSVYTIIKNRDNTEASKVNEEILTIFLDNKVITAKNLDRLIEKNKITVENKDFLENYR